MTRATRPRTWTALVNTGANMSIVSPAVVLALQPPRLRLRAGGPLGRRHRTQPTYDLRFRLGGHVNTPNRWFPLEAAEIQPATTGVNLIIGTDLLIKLELVWHGPSRHGFLAY